MVQVSGYKQVATKDGRTFITLEITGGLEFVQSQQTGKFYATVRKCRIPSTFDEAIAEKMVGQQIEGKIVRVEADPYEYTIKTTGEVIMLKHAYAYQPVGSSELIGQREEEFA